MGQATQPRKTSPVDCQFESFQHIVEKLPAAAYTCDADGLITYFNQRASEFWGRAPRLNDPIDRY